MAVKIMEPVVLEDAINYVNIENQEMEKLWFSRENSGSYNKNQFY
jgi:hypothetical protein